MTSYNVYTVPPNQIPGYATGWRSSVGAEAECMTSDWTAVSMSSFLTVLSLQHEQEADRERQTSRIRICVDRR